MKIKILAKKEISIRMFDNLSSNFIQLKTQIIHKKKNILTSFTKKTKAFSLVELIIVIAILGILATLAFISFKNYSNTSRDSVRVSDMQTIFQGLSIYKVKSGIYPFPDNAVEISAGNTILTHQGEISTGIKNIISLHGKGQDPKDHTNYIYAVDKKKQKGQLLGYLENGDTIRHFSVFPQIYANEVQNYSQRFIYIYGDKLGIITDENKNPIQYTTTNTGINLLDDEYQEKELITYIGGDVGNGGKTTSTGNVLAQEIEKSLSGSLSCGSKNYNDYVLSGLEHNITGNFTKEIVISNGNQVLELSILCNNGEYDTSGATENIVNTTCTTSGYIPYNNTCVLNACQGSLPLNATSTATSENHQVSWNYSETPGECSFQCALNYTYNSGTHICEPDSRTQSCGNIPNNSVYNSVNTISQTWNGSTWLPSITSLHNTTSSSNECRFICNSGYTYDSASNSCVGNSCTTPTSGVHNGLTYSLTSQSLVHGNSVTITSTNRAFGTSPAHGTTSARFTYSCNAGVLSLTSTANNAGSCITSGYTFNNNYSSPACTSPCNWQYHAVFGPVGPVNPNPNTTQCTYANNGTIAWETTSPYQKVATCTCN